MSRDILVFSGLLLMLAGCEGSTSAASSTGAAPDMDGARKVFHQKCVVCHGEAGKGDGPGAASLDPRPRAFGEDAWQESTTDEQLRKIIVGGGPAAGKSAIMPPNPELKDKPAVVEGLVKIVRSFKGK